MNTTKGIDEAGVVNPTPSRNGTETCTGTSTETPTGGGKPAGYVKIAAMTTAAQYLASCGGASAKGLKLRAQLLWWQLVMLGGGIISLEDGRAGAEVYGRTSRIAALAERMNTSESTVRKAMAELVDAGLIRRQRTTRGFRTFVLLPDAALRAMPSPSFSVSATTSEDVQDHASSGDVVAGEPVHASPGGRFHASSEGRSVVQNKSQTKSQTTTTTREGAEPSAGGDPPDGGGGSLPVQDGDTEQADRVESMLAIAGVFVGMREQLTAKVMAMPDGPDRLEKTYERVRSTTRSPAAVLTAAIRRGELDELDERERSRQQAEQTAQERGETLGEYLDRIWTRLDNGDALNVAPLMMQSLLRRRMGIGDDHDLEEYKRVKKKLKQDPTGGRVMLMNLEKATAERYRDYCERKGDSGSGETDGLAKAVADRMALS